VTVQKHSFSVRASGSDFEVLRDNEPLLTPAGARLALPTGPVAEAVIGEFAQQGEKNDVRKMPLTQLALTALDRVCPQQEETIQGIMAYGDTELLCQRAENPPELIAEECQTWQPYLDWCETEFKAALTTGTGIVPFRQNPEALAALRAAVEKLDAFALAGLQEACGLLGSLVLALALLRGKADARAVLQAAELERLWQNRKWGEDQALQSRAAEIERDLATVERWFELLKTSA
jgi:chaperone required for assembly of F1-ATPase